MVNPWVTKLEQSVALTSQDKNLLDSLIRKPRHYSAGEDIIAVGDVPDHVNVVLDGWVCRYKILRRGERQIVAILLPGDFCDLTVFILKAMDHSIGAITDCTVAKIPRADILDILKERPNLTTALWWSSLQDEAVLREWIVGLGRRSAYQRTAHLLYEIYSRMTSVGLKTDGIVELPLTQRDLSDMAGLTYVHLNRVLQAMRKQGLISLSPGSLAFPDPEKMRVAADFNPDYLHLRSRRA